MMSRSSWRPQAHRTRARTLSIFSLRDTCTTLELHVDIRCSFECFGVISLKKMKESNGKEHSKCHTHTRLHSHHILQISLFQFYLFVETRARNERSRTCSLVKTLKYEMDLITVISRSRKPNPNSFGCTWNACPWNAAEALASGKQNYEIVRNGRSQSNQQKAWKRAHTHWMRIKSRKYCALAQFEPLFNGNILPEFLFLAKCLFWSARNDPHAPVRRWLQRQLVPINNQVFFGALFKFRENCAGQSRHSVWL